MMRADRRTLLAGLLGSGLAIPGHAALAGVRRRIWDRANRFAWTVAPFDAIDRSPEERAAMLARLGFKAYAFSWRPQHIAMFDRELAALKAHGIDLIGWSLFTNDIDEAPAIAVLEAIARSSFRPTLWLTASWARKRARPGVATLLPSGFPMPGDLKALAALAPADRAVFDRAFRRWRDAEFAPAPADHRRRVAEEAEHIARTAAIARRHGLKVALYNHNGWFGHIPNQLEIIARLERMGVRDVGIVYNFSHARDEWHDDTRDFPALWHRIQRHVVAVNVTGVRWEGDMVYPSQGDSELAMMRTIERSGWRGPVGMLAENGGDAEVTLGHYLRGVDWLADEIARPGAAGPPPFPALPPRTSAAR